MRQRGLLLLLLAAAALAGCSSPVRPAARAAGATGLVYALLDDNRLLAIRPAAGAVVAERALAPPPAATTVRFAHQYLALSPDGRTLYALAPGDPGGADRLALLDPATATVRATRVLPDSGDVYLTLAVGPRTGDLYLFGTRDGAAIVTALGPDGAALHTWAARGGDGLDWLVYQGAVSADERQVYLSYHGARTTGIDRFALTPGGLARCPTVSQPGDGCLPAHGGFLLWHGGLLAATGFPEILREDPSGHVEAAYDTHLVGNHLMEFAVDPAADHLYAVGSCGYTGGYSVVDLRHAGAPATPGPDGDFRWAATPAPPLTLLSPPGPPCGERIAFVPGGIVAVARLPRPAPRLGAPGAVLLLDAADGHTLHSLPTTAEPLDVFAVP